MNRQYIIKTDAPFAGYVQSALCEDGSVMYTEYASFEAYCEANGPNHRLIDDEELDGLIAAHLESLITEPKEETEEQFSDALDVLPPCRWHSHMGVNMFHISERLTYSLVEWHARLDGKYYRFTDHDYATSDHLAEKVGLAHAALILKQIARN